MAAAAKTLQSCPTLCDPRDGSPPGSAIPGILQARTLEWVAISFSNAWKWKGKVKSFSRVRPLATPWTAAYQAPPSTGFSRQEYWSGLPLPLCQLIKHVFLLWLQSISTGLPLETLVWAEWIFFFSFSCWFSVHRRLLYKLGEFSFYCSFSSNSPASKAL